MTQNVSFGRELAGAGAMLLASVASVALVGPGEPLVGRSESSHGPGVRNAHAMTYDEDRELTLLYGGADSAVVRSDIWAWDGHSWRLTEVEGPPGRTFPAFVWDAARREVVLFGGRRVLFGREGEVDTCLSDTWVLRADRWDHRDVSGPSPRCEPGAAFDRQRGNVVVFGGFDDRTSPVTRLGDTWEWDGMRWHLRARGGPAARSGVAMGYDERLRRVVLFGGSGGPRSDTWTWDGVQWELVKTPATPGRFNSVAQYDAVTRRLLRTTGWNGQTRVQETWLFDYPRWQLVSSGGPAARNHSAVASDRRRRRVVLHGGHDGTFVFGDTWEWDGMAWVRRIAEPPRRRTDNEH